MKDGKDYYEEDGKRNRYKNFRDGSLGWQTTLFGRKKKVKKNINKIEKIDPDDDDDDWESQEEQLIINEEVMISDFAHSKFQ